ncbi:MAG: universal stress protein [Burkholderiales bacterium]
MYKRILLAYDGSQTGQKALLDCSDIAQWAKSELFLVAVMPSPATFIGAEGGVYDAGSEERDREQYQAILDEGLRRLAEAGHNANGEVVVGDAVDEIAKCASRISADLIVVGHRHLEGWAARWWRGSVSKALIEHSPCNVLVVITH